MTTRRLVAAAAAAAALSLALAACSSGDAAEPGTAQPAASGTSPAPAGSVDLADVCPATVVVQTDWNPQSEQGGLFELLGPDAKIDAQQKTISGSLYSKGRPTGVNVEIRAGGPAIGYTAVPAQMYTDKDILLGWVNTDEAIQNSQAMPTTAVFATFEKAPWMVMWDPATYPDVKTIADLGKTDAVVRYFNGATWMDYLVGSGQLRKDHTDGGYDGTPANFVAAKGKDGQQGFATVEPYVYQNEIKEWGKPVDYQLIADTGYPLYAVALSVRSDDVSKQSACLKKLVPVVQQSTADFFADPTAANALIVKAVEEYNTGWVYPAGEAASSAKEQVSLGLVSNGTNDELGDFDEARVQKILDLTTPILTKNGTAPRPGLKATDLFTNDFLDPSIGLGS